LNKPEFKEPSEIVRRFRNGLELFERDDNTFKRVDLMEDLPEFLKQNPERFSYLLDRDPVNANFRDYAGP
jgi:beta-1,4-mannosyl-glycoprotein beta-1,4-N-acetylglucosaminyltransferase